MSRLYEYADSNDKSGLFLLDGYKGNNTTFQVTTIAERLLLHLDYEPGTLHQERGPRIPDELHWGLFEIGWVYTNESGITPPTNAAGEIVVEGEGVEITEEIAQDLKLFLQKEDGDDMEELAEILNLDISGQTEDSSNGLPTTSGTPQDGTDSGGLPTPPKAPFCDISDTRCHEIAKKVAEHLEIEVDLSEDSEWGITYISGGKINPDTDNHQIIIKTERQYGDEEQYFHKAIFSPENGLEEVWTITNVMLDWNQRIQLEQHRKEIIKSIISVATDEHIDIGDPMCDLELTTEYGPSIEQF